jgi:hypothetical protein
MMPVDGHAFANALLALALDFPEHSKSDRNDHHYSEPRGRTDYAMTVKNEFRRYGGTQT